VGDTVEGPTTLSGRPAVEERVAAASRPPTRVSRTSAFFFTAFLVVVLVVAALAFLRRGPEGTDVRDMQAGQCYTEVDTVNDGGRIIPFGTDTPCTTLAPRIVAVVTLPLGPFPGVDGLNRIIGERCGGEQDQVIAPTDATWDGGDRTVVCIALPEA
jgi:hypothetical protein